MKPFGIKGGGSFRDLVTEHTDEEIVICKEDSHLDFRVVITCTRPADGKQTASVTTVVRFNNLLGRIYFAGIWVFHTLRSSQYCRSSSGSISIE